MFKKILIAEDYESSNISVQKALEDLRVPHPSFVSYCDDALSRVKMALVENNPYELLITDLSFEEDHREQKIKNGKELINAIKAIQPEIKVVVFSVNKKQSIIDELFQEQQINAYVRKAREDVKDLKRAVKAVYNNEKHLTYDLKGVEKNAFELTTYDTLLISYISQGIMVKEIPMLLKELNIKPNGMSSVEKRLRDIKISLEVSSNEQLVAFCKDFGII